MRIIPHLSASGRLLAVLAQVRVFVGSGGSQVLNLDLVAFVFDFNNNSPAPEILASATHQRRNSRLFVNS